MNSSQQEHEPLLDGVRGLAIFSVIIFHSSLIPNQNFFDKLLHGMSLAGWAGVDLFFVLSGFLITGILLRTKGTPNFFFNFYMRRSLRIMPLYYLFLVFFFYFVPQTVSFGFTYWTFLSNVLLSRLGHFQSAILDITWSLAVEEQFYLLWPLIVWSTKREKLAKVAFILFLVSLAIRIGLFWSGANPMKNYMLLVCRMDGLCAGAWLACRLDFLSPKTLKRMFYGMIGINAVVFCWDVGLDSVLMRTVGYSANALLAASLLGCLCTREIPLLNSFFGIKFLRVCGKYSYGMYLLHMPVIHWIHSKGESVWTPLQHAFGMGLPVQILFHTVSVGATLIAAMIVYHGYEKYFLKLKKHFENQPKLVSALAT